MSVPPGCSVSALWATLSSKMWKSVTTKSMIFLRGYFLPPGPTKTSFSCLLSERTHTHTHTHIFPTKGHSNFPLLSSPLAKKEEGITTICPMIDSLEKQQQHGEINNQQKEIQSISFQPKTEASFAKLPGTAVGGEKPHPVDVEPRRNLPTRREKKGATGVP